jgi:CheY-like chemotaxis protein
MSMPLHVLVVDDRPDSVLLLSEFMTSRGHLVETCTLAKDALEAILRRHRSKDAYDLLICDVSMPGMDGITLLREIRRRQVLVPVALYTAFSSVYPNLNTQIQGLGCLGVLEKPIELRHVQRVLDEVIARRHGTTRHGTTRLGTTVHGTTRHAPSASEQDQPFFGTARVAKNTTTGTHRQEANPPAEFNQSQTGAQALEPKLAQLSPAPPAPLILHPPLPPIPLPIRSPQPFPVAPQEPQTRSMPSFRTPSPESPEQHDNTEHRVKPSFRTPLPFLHGAPPPTAPRGQSVVTNTPSSPTSRPPQQPPALYAHPENEASPQPIKSTAAIVRRSVNPLTSNISGSSGHASNELHGSQQTQPSNTTRIRRSVNGPLAPPMDATSTTHRHSPAPAETSYAVTCAHCGQVFMVAACQNPYNAICVHCGQTNRINPL